MKNCYCILYSNIIIYLYCCSFYFIMHVQLYIFHCRQVIKQNLELLSDIKVLKRHHTLTMQNNLYKRPDGFPLKTIEEFENLEADTDRLQELVSNMHFSINI